MAKAVSTEIKTVGPGSNLCRGLHGEIAVCVCVCVCILCVVCILYAVYGLFCMYSVYLCVLLCVLTICGVVCCCVYVVWAGLHVLCCGHV